MIRLTGIIPPLPTPFHEDERLAPAEMQANIRKLNRFDLAGYLVLGSNGELAHLSETEIGDVFATAREAIPAGKLMLAGTGMQSTRLTIAMSRRAADAGADAVLVLPPSYYRGQMTREALIAHFWSVADASTIPMIIYNMPACTGMDLDAETIVAISGHENIVGLKDSGGNVVKMGDIRRMATSEFQLLAGSAGFLLPALTMGATGGILALANIAPGKCLSVYDDFRSGKMDSAQKTQLDLIPVNAAVTSKWGVPALKAAMNHLGYFGGFPRKPLLPLADDKKRDLIHLMETHLPE